MTRIIIAGSSEKSRAQVSQLLASSGYPVFRMCASEGELRRTLNDTEDGILILAGRMPDLRPDEIFWDYGDRLKILLIARGPVLEECESREIFRLEMPVAAQTVLGSVEMLSQLHRMHLPQRAASEREKVDAAKALLMKKLNLTEPEAHRMLQRHAMDHGMKMSEYAELVIRKGE